MDVWQCGISTSTKQRMTLPKQRGKYSSEKRDNKRRSWASVLSEAEELLSSPKQKKKKKKTKAKTQVYWFWKNPVTGLQTTHSKHHVRKSSKTSIVEPESCESFF